MNKLAAFCKVPTGRRPPAFTRELESQRAFLLRRTEMPACARGASRSEIIEYIRPIARGQRHKIAGESGSSHGGISNNHQGGTRPFPSGKSIFFNRLGRSFTRLGYLRLSCPSSSDIMFPSHDRRQSTSIFFWFFLMTVGDEMATS